MTKNTGTFQKWSLFIAGLLICSFGDSMNFKASIGVTPYEATQLTAFFITGIKVGTLAIISNFILLGGQLMIRKKMTPSMLLQIPLCVLQGYILNLIIYTIFGKISLNYPVKVVFLLCGIFLSGAGVGMMVVADITVFPLEGFCEALSDAKKIDFAKVRQGADVLFVVSCVLVSLIFHYPLAIREGSVAAALFFSRIMNASMKLFSEKRLQYR